MCQEYRHKSDSKVLHSTGRQCGTISHLIELNLCDVYSVSLTGSNCSWKLNLILLDSNGHHPWHFCDPGAVYESDYLLSLSCLTGYKKLSC